MTVPDPEPGKYARRCGDCGGSGYRVRWLLKMFGSETEREKAMSDCSAGSGTCSTCQAGCTRKPGWFLPGEAEGAADLLGLSMEEFFARYLAVDWWVGHAEETFVLSPTVVGEPAGEEFPGDPRGTCVFYVGGRCQIHEAKPYECRVAWCGMPPRATTPDVLTHEQVAVRWEGEPQKQIKRLLGRDPVAAEFESGGLLGLLGGAW